MTIITIITIITIYTSHVLNTYKIADMFVNLQGIPKNIRT